MRMHRCWPRLAAYHHLLAPLAVATVLMAGLAGVPGCSEQARGSEANGREEEDSQDDTDIPLLGEAVPIFGTSVQTKADLQSPFGAEPPTVIVHVTYRLGTDNLGPFTVAYEELDPRTPIIHNGSPTTLEIKPDDDPPASCVCDDDQQDATYRVAALEVQLNPGVRGEARLTIKSAPIAGQLMSTDKQSEATPVHKPLGRDEHGKITIKVE